MTAALRATLLLGLLAAAAAVDKPAPAIINGQDAPRGRFRYMAQLLNADNPTRPHCDGALIHPSVILTAGHCVRETSTGADFPPEYFRPVVHIGGYLRTTEPNGPGQQYQSFRVAQTAVHPKFKTGFTDPVTKDFMNFDAALMLLPAPSTMPTIKLAPRSVKPTLPAPAGARVDLVGWGISGFVNGTAVNKEPLQMLAQTLLPLSACQAKFGTENAKGDNGVNHLLQYNFANVNNSMICAARIGVPTASACMGDSGGPLLVAGRDASQDYQVGIVSWGSDKCDSAINVYTDVGMVFDWIQDKVFRWTGDRLHPWTPPPFRPVTGTVLADNVGVGFDGNPVTYTGAKGSPLDIISSVPAKGMGWYLNGILTDGSAPGSQALGYVAWSYGATLAAQAGPSGRLTVTLNNKVVKQGHAPDLGKLVAVRYPRDSCRRGWCADRLVEITVRPFIKVAITQPWIVGATWSARGAFAPYLQVKVTLLQRPSQQPTGVLGQTILV